jgi:hypothetical protein
MPPAEPPRRGVIRECLAAALLVPARVSDDAVQALSRNGDAAS